MLSKLLLGALVAMPLILAALTWRLREVSPGRARQLSAIGAVMVVLLASLAAPDISLATIAGRQLSMLPEAQFGIQLLGLALLGFIMANSGAAAGQEGWLPMAWLSTTGLVLSLLIRSLPIALLAFIGAALIWSLGMSASARRTSSAVTLRYITLLALALPLILIALQLAELRRDLSDVEAVERLVLALAVPAFGIILGLIPLHAWTFTLAGSTPRAMVFGVTSLVQTAGFALMLRTLADHPWMSYGASDVLVPAGAVSCLFGGWLALSAPREDPDDWLIYATVANTGLLLVGLGSHSEAAGTGVVLLLFARVLALVLVDLAALAEPGRQRLALAVGTLTLAGTPGLAGFPGLWLILRRLQAQDSPLPVLAIVGGCGLLFSTAVRRWASFEPQAQPEGPARRRTPGIHRAILMLILLTVVLGVMPGVFAPSLDDVLRKLNLPGP